MGGGEGGGLQTEQGRDCDCGRMCRSRLVGGEREKEVSGFSLLLLLKTRCVWGVLLLGGARDFLGCVCEGRSCRGAVQARGVQLRAWSDCPLGGFLCSGIAKAGLGGCGPRLPALWGVKPGVSFYECPSWHGAPEPRMPHVLRGTRRESAVDAPVSLWYAQMAACSRACAERWGRDSWDPG